MPAGTDGGRLMDDRVVRRNTALVSGVAFGVLFAGLFGLAMGWLPPHNVADIVTTVVTALLVGPAFGFLFSRRLWSQAAILQAEIEPPVGEVVEHSAPANHMQKFEGRGGQLFLTERNLIFKPHRMNIQSNVVTIPRHDIAGVAATRTLGLVPNGLKVVLRDGTVHRFVVRDREEWVRVLSGAADPTVDSNLGNAVVDDRFHETDQL
jgi:hypothetical protein